MGVRPFFNNFAVTFIVSSTVTCEQFFSNNWILPPPSVLLDTKYTTLWDILLLIQNLYHILDEKNIFGDTLKLYKDRGGAGGVNYTYPLLPGPYCSRKSPVLIDVFLRFFKKKLYHTEATHLVCISKKSWPNLCYLWYRSRLLRQTVVPGI